MKKNTVPARVSDLPYSAALEDHPGGPLSPGNHDVIRVEGEDFGGAYLDGSQFLESAFSTTGFDGARLRRCRFNDVWMHTVRMVGTDMTESAWLDSYALSSLFSGTAAFNAQVQRVVFSSCKLNAVNFRAARLFGVVFEDCQLTDVDFGEASLTQVSFPGSNIEGLLIPKAQLQKVDFRGAAELDVASGYESLRGATISHSQLMALAPALAANAGITVAD